MPHQRTSHARLLPVYTLLVGLPVLALLLILRVGETFAPTDGMLHGARAALASVTTSAATPVPVAPSAPVLAVPDLPLLLVQIIVILVAARVVGTVVRRLGQPQVVGEMLAGIALGPSLLGAYAPGLAAALFPANSLGFLNALSQIGLPLFMLLIGLELDPR